MITLQILSDLHLEAPKGYDVFKIAPRSPYLALLGDVGCIGRDYAEYTEFLFAQLQQFEIVFLVLGNHEPYHSSWNRTKILMDDFQNDVHARTSRGEQLGTFVLLDQKRHDIDKDQEKITILGCTLFSRIPEAGREAVSFGINDFYHINDWTVEQHDEQHQRDATWLRSQIKSLQGSGRQVVVLTHYSPTWDAQSQDPRHRNSSITPGFATDLLDDPTWQNDSVKLWAFGHTHYNCDFKNDQGMRLYTNQRGYYFSQSDGFDVTSVVEI